MHKKSTEKRKRNKTTEFHFFYVKNILFNDYLFLPNEKLFPFCLIRAFLWRTSGRSVAVQSSQCQSLNYFSPIRNESSFVFEWMNVCSLVVLFVVLFCYEYRVKNSKHTLVVEWMEKTALRGFGWLLFSWYLQRLREWDGYSWRGGRNQWEKPKWKKCVWKKSK